MIVHAYYDEDPRVRREAETLVGAGWSVDVFGLRRPEDEAEGELHGVRVHRLPVHRHQGAPLRIYVAEYLAFLFRAAMAVTHAHRRRRFALVQVHTIPDFLVFAALPVKLAGVPVVLDFHEAMPEFFASRFPGAANPLTMALVRLQERASAVLADAIVTINVAVAERLAERGVARGKITVVHNSPSADLFDPAAHPHRGFMEDGTLRLLYAGALTPNYELDVVLDAVARVRREGPDLPVRLEVYGRGDAEATLQAMTAQLGLGDAVRFHGRVPLDRMAAAVAGADVGLAPVRRNPQTELSLPGKILEYTVMGKPVVASDLATTVRTFGPDLLSLYRAGDAADLADRIRGLAQDRAAAEARARRAGERVAEMAWDREATVYVDLVARLRRGSLPVG